MVSPYMSMGDDPIKHNDPNGDVFGIDNLIGSGVGALVEIGTQLITNKIEGKGFVMDKGGWYKVGAAAVEGFVTDGSSNMARLGVKAGAALVKSYVDNHEKGAGSVLKGTAGNLLIDKAAGLPGKLAAKVEIKMINNAAKKIVGSQTQIAKHIMANNNIKSQTAHAVAKVVNKTERAVANQVKEIQKKVAETSTGISITVGKDKYNENH